MMKLLSPTLKAFVLGISFSSACALAMPGHDAHDVPKEIKGHNAALHGTHVASSPQATLTPRQAVKTEETTIELPGVNKKFRLVIARPEKVMGKLPAVILIHEWWGLNENIEAMAKQLAGEGYLVGAIDVYGAAATTNPGIAARNYAQATANQTQVNKIVEETSKKLLSQKDAKGPKVGVMGWCFGGNQTLHAAINMGDKVAASVVYYGISIKDEEKLKKIKSPVLGLYGEKDQLIPIPSLTDMYGKLKKLGVVSEYHVYPGAGHAFANPSGGGGKSYQKEAAEDSWKRTLGWFKKYLP